MKIPVYHIPHASNKDRLRCPGCHGSQCRKHGFYERKGFHAPNGATALPVRVQRYRCRNPQCCLRSFSLLPAGVVPYCRFFWPDLLAIGRALSAGTSVYYLARHVWRIGRGVILRARALLKHMQSWASELHRELSDGGDGGKLERMVRFIAVAIGPVELVRCWYRHRYPRRVLPQKRPTHNLVSFRQHSPVVNFLA